MDTVTTQHGLIPPHDTIGKSYSPPRHIKILDIPTEILLIILQHAADSSLYSLSLLSKRLHYLALPIYFTRHGISDHNDTLYLSYLNMDCILALRTALFITSYRSISCIFREARIGVLSDMRQLTGLLSKLTHINEIDLVFDNVHFWQGGMILSDNAADSNSDVWNRHFGALLSVIAERSCTSLTIRGGSLATFVPRQLDGQLKDYLAKPRSALTRFASALFAEPRNGRVNNPLPCKTLKVLHVSSSLPFYRPFLKWTLSTLKHSSIVTLILDNLRISYNSWALLLPRITLPSLSKLSLKSCSLRFADLSKFLLRHRIKILQLCSTTFDSRRTFPLPLPMTVRSHLTSVCGSNQYLPGLLLNMAIDPCPNLASITIHPAPPPSLYNIEQQLNDECLRRIAQLKRSDIHVEMTIFPDAIFPYRFINTLTVHPETMESRVERSLYCVRSLELTAAPRTSCLPEPDILLLPRWLALFPSLVEVAFGTGFLPYMSEERMGVFVKEVAEVCPKMKSIAIENRKRDVEEWLAGAYRQQ